MTQLEELARLGVATIHESQGKTGLVDIGLVQIVPGSRVAGRARTALCANGDNLMVHAAVAHAEPGDVLVLTMPDPAPVAIVGDLLATQALDQGVAGILVDAAVRDVEPDLVLGHARQDPFNPDHGVASEATIRARQLASGAGVASGFRTITPPALLLFEPHQPELCGFVPTTFLDITPVWEQKVAAMEAMGAQEYLRQYYTERAGHRANHARRISGRSDIRHAEAFQREIPQVVDRL